MPDCPDCGKPMEAGTFSVEASLWAIVLAGFSCQRLWFRRKGAQQAETVIVSGGRRTGFVCTRCGAYLIAGNPGDETNPNYEDWPRMAEPGAD